MENWGRFRRSVQMPERSSCAVTTQRRVFYARPAIVLVKRAEDVPEVKHIHLPGRSWDWKTNRTDASAEKLQQFRKAAGCADHCGSTSSIESTG